MTTTPHQHQLANNKTMTSWIENNTTTIQLVLVVVITLSLVPPHILCTSFSHPLLCAMAATAVYYCSSSDTIHLVMGNLNCQIKL